MSDFKHRIKLYDLWLELDDGSLKLDEFLDKISERLMAHPLAKEDADNIEYFAEGFVEIGKEFKGGKTYEELFEKFDDFMCEFYDYADEDYLLWIE